MIFTAHHFAFFVYSSLSLPNDMSIPAPTIARTPRRRTIFTNQLTIVAIIPWNELSHFPTLHSYFGVGVPGAHSLTSVDFVHPAVHTHPAQGTYSEVGTLTDSLAFISEASFMLSGVSPRDAYMAWKGSSSDSETKSRNFFIKEMLWYVNESKRVSVIPVNTGIQSSWTGFWHKVRMTETRNIQADTPNTWIIRYFVKMQ